MRKSVQDIVNIQFGPYYKGKDKGDIKYLLSSHFDSNNMLSKFEKSYVDENEKTLKTVLQDGDVLLTGKGTRLFAWTYERKMGKCVASSLFYVLRLHTSQVLPKYLTYYLNSDRSQFILNQIGAGATILSIPKKELAKMTIEFPSLEEQSKIVEILQKIEEDIDLTTQLLDKKKQLKRGLINHMIKN